MTTDRPTDPAASPVVAAQSAGTGQVSYAIFDQALWTQFAKAESAEAFVNTWLALVARFVDGATAALVVMGEPNTGPFAPAAQWPDANAITPDLTALSEQALGKRQPVMSKSATQNTVALPLLMDDALYGVVAISVGAHGTAPDEVIRHLRWGAGWIEVLMRRDQGRAFEKLQDRTAVALDMLATVLEQKSFSASCQALVTELARKLHCDPVSIGFRRGKNVKVTALSHAAGFGKRMNIARDIRAAMNEAVDQQAVVSAPHNDAWEYRVSLAHEELARSHKADGVLTVPIQHDGAIIGAITLERSGAGAFDDETVELVDTIATVVGPVLEEKRRNDRYIITKLWESLVHQFKRLLGPSHFGRKIVALVCFGLVWFFATTTTTFTITAPAELQGEIQRTVVAPFNGYLASENVNAGALVSAGDELARLDDQDLALERLRLTTSRGQRQAEYDQALANRERAQANIIESQISQIDSQIALVDEQISRTVILAPFDGVVVSGDLSQSVGTTLERGQELYRIAPLDAYRVVLEVDETDMAEIAVAQTGQLRVASLPDVPLMYTISRVTPISQQRDGRNFFRVDATLETADPRLRPAMEGIARTNVDERLLFHVWTRPLVNWAKLTFWRWKP